MPQPLSSKERSLFAQVVKNYEGKQPKKGLKAADQILRKVPNHGDTQAMKALIINGQGHTEEAFALAKEALKNDMKSHVCWHVYGLLYRSVKNFEEAIKAYKFALKLEPESQQIQRDLALLQMQMRDYPGYLQSRWAMLQAKSSVRQNWTALAVAQHLAGNLVDAERTLTTYEETLKQPPAKTDIEHSEAVLYKNTIIAEMGETERALEHLNAVTKGNLDRTAVMEMQAQYLLKLDRKCEAEKAYRALIDRNAEYRAYYEGLEKAMSLDRTDPQSLKKLYEEYALKNPRGDAARRIPLDFLEGDDFREAADQYLQLMLHKSVPSTFANVKALYSDPAKRVVIQDLVEGYTTSKGVTQSDGSDAKQANGEDKSFESSVFYFLAQHYNYHLSRDLVKAMEFIEKAISHKPESVDFHMTKARTLKHSGNTRKASAMMESARNLDIRDRYINTKAAKYQLRNNDQEAAINTMGKFTKIDAVGGPLGDLLEMQCVWFITEDGESSQRQRKHGLALKRFHAVKDIFEVWQEDQFDFHSFSLRKGQIRAYVDMVRWEDHLREHPYFSRAALAAIEVYLSIYDNPEFAHGELINGVNGNAGKSTSDEKKAKKKAKKDQQKQDQIEAEKKDVKKTAGVNADGELKKKDNDPTGIKLVETSDTLKEAMKFLEPLLEFSPRDVQVQKVGFEVFARRKKYLLALRCLLAAHSLAASDPVLHEQLIRFRHMLNTLSTPLPAKVSEIIESELAPLIPPDTNLTMLNSDFLLEHPGSPRHTYAGLRARHLLDPSDLEINQQAILAILEVDSSSQELSLEDAIAGLRVLEDWHSSQDILEEFITEARKRFPEATVFEKK